MFAGFLFVCWLISRGLRVEWKRRRAELLIVGVALAGSLFAQSFDAASIKLNVDGTPYVFNGMKSPGMCIRSGEPDSSKSHSGSLWHSWGTAKLAAILYRGWNGYADSWWTEMDWFRPLRHHRQVDSPLAANRWTRCKRIWNFRLRSLLEDRFQVKEFIARLEIFLCMK